MKRNQSIYVVCREEQLGRLRSGQEFDILVIGGGVTGCGITLDAQLRGTCLWCGVCVCMCVNTIGEYL